MINEKKYLLIGIPILFIAGALFHFLYEFSNENFIVGLISPVNESIWEHTKMILLPMTIYWTIYYKKNKNVNRDNWFYALLISLVTSIITIPLLYYFYTESFGIESLIIDISLLLIAITIGHILGYHIYKYKKNTISYIVSILLIILLFIIYFIFTIYPPDLPLFVPN